MKRYLLTEPSFIGSALLAAGSIITDADLPYGAAMEPGRYEGPPENRVWIAAAPKADGSKVRSAPPASAIEIDASGQPVHKADLAALAGITDVGTVIEVAPIAPHAPNPTMPQALPPHGIGEVMPAGTYVAAEGVQTDAEAELAKEALAAQSIATDGAPKRRGTAK